MYKKTILFMLLLTILITAYTFLILNQMKFVMINRTNESLGIKKYGVSDLESKGIKDLNVSEGIENIALFGLDKNKPNDSARSDSILIFTIDYKNKKIKVSSIMRDLRVPIENHGFDKINHAYSYGGPQLAIKTINQNFGMNIRDFVAVDFIALEKVVDSLGGVCIDVKDSEIPYTNENIHEKNNYVQKGGLQLLKGEQAVAYARVRKVGSGDFERTERQRKILIELLKKIQSRETSLPGYIGGILPYVETSMDKYDIISLSAKCIGQGVNTLEEERFPIDGYWKDDNIGGIYYLVTDLDATKKHLNDFIFRDRKTTPDV